MQIPTHPEYVPVIYQSASERWDSTVILNTSDPVPLATLEGTETENVIRRTIATLTGIEQQVMSDLYRHLVLSNFTVLDGKGGRSAASDLDKKYPDHQTLPERKQKSGRVNTSGVIVSILLEGGEAHKKDAFSILGGILISLLRAGVLETPVLDAIASPAPLTQEPADVKAPPIRVRTETYRILRDTEVARRVKRMHQYKCQMADCDYSMQLPNGSSYAEAHHIQPLGGDHKGEDVIGNILCLCPNHHVELDYGVRAILPATLRRLDDHRIGSEYIEYHNREIHKSGKG